MYELVKLNKSIKVNINHDLYMRNEIFTTKWNGHKESVRMMRCRWMKWLHKDGMRVNDLVADERMSMGKCIWMTLSETKFRVWQLSLFKYLYQIAWVMEILMKSGRKVFKYIRPAICPYMQWHDMLWG